MSKAFLRLSSTALLIISSVVLSGQLIAAQASSTTQKELYLPKKVTRVPENNDYHNDESEFCFARMVQGDNIAIFWSRIVSAMIRGM